MAIKRVGGNIPQLNRNPEGEGIKRLFFSERDVALIFDKTVQGGFGYLQAGTVMAINKSTTGNGVGKLVPYVPVVEGITFGEDSALGASILLQDATATTLKISINDSYRFNVGDIVCAENSSEEGPVVATISDIDRTTDARWATLTVSSFSHENFTTAKSAYIYTKAAAATPYMTAAYVLDKAIDTGEGIEANGALTSIVVSNAILYTNSLINMTATAKTDLSVVTDGQFTILK